MTGAKVVLITGAGGWLASLVADAVCELQPEQAFRFILVDVQEPKPPAFSKSSTASEKETSKSEWKCLALDLTDDQNVDSLFTTSWGRPDVVIAMHGIMSLGSEENWERGFEVNFDSHRALLNKAKRYRDQRSLSSSSSSPITYVYVSATAVYGQPLPDVIEPTTATFPSGAYGTAKLLIEQLVTEYSRKGWVDGISVRPPTVVVRPGPPARASSAFVSGIIREPLEGKDAVCPIGTSVADEDGELRNTRLWVASGGATVRNIARAMRVDRKKMLPFTRSVELPGFTVSVAEEIEALRRVAGEEAVTRIKFEPDETCRRLVQSWPAQFDNSYATKLGFEVDKEGFAGCIREYMQLYIMK